jgi:hypothetical protein
MEAVMELIRGEEVAVLESHTNKICSTCGKRLALIRTIVNPRTGCIVHMFECRCGQRTWEE